MKLKWRKKAKRFIMQKQQKQALKEAEGKECSKCGKCCMGFSLPTKILSKDLIDYFSYHKGVEIRKQDGQQFIYINARCEHLTECNLCAIYDHRPIVCRDAYIKNRTGAIFQDGCTLK